MNRTDSKVIEIHSTRAETQNPLSEICWKTVGVWGNVKPRCPNLEKVIHCRNCEIFISAGRNLLERDMPDEYKTEWTEVMSAEKEDDLPGTVSAVVFRIEEEWLALRTTVFSEIIAPENLRSHSLPHRKNPILIGVVNIHGEIQLCISLKELLGIEAGYPEKQEKPATHHRVMVLNSSEGQWVFPVNEILGIYRIHPNMFQNVPVTVAKAQSTFTKGLFHLENRQVALLDDDLLLYSLKRNLQ